MVIIMVKKIPLTQGKYALVNDEDFDYLAQWKWLAHWSPGTKSYYAKRNARKGEIGWISKNRRRLISMHAEIMNLPKGMFVDHINHDTLDNRRNNLRSVTHRQNHQNRRQSKYSKYPGVSWDKSREKWIVLIQVNGKRKNIGRFNSEIEAFKAYKTAVFELTGEKVVSGLGV